MRACVSAPDASAALSVPLGLNGVFSNGRVPSACEWTVALRVPFTELRNSWVHWQSTPLSCSRHALTQTLT